VHFAWRIWRAASDPSPVAERGEGPRAGFGQALLLQVSNPKVMVFFGSVFMAVLPPQLPATVEVVVLAMILAVEFGWYGTVAAVFGSASARAVHGRAKAWIDRAMAVLLAGLGARLLLSPLLG
jgi:threonine/homoserine/homoserine lactone efflux protein